MNYVKPHTIVARKATKEDTERMLEDGSHMYDMCDTPPEGHPGAYAIAHTQVDDTDPLRFFITNKGSIVINPEILRHTRHTVEMSEGCTSFPEEGKKDTKRYHKCDVKYWTIEDDETLEWVEKTESLSGREAQIFQHEIDHLDGKNIYAV